MWGLGGHVIKCGLAPVLTDLMERGYATALPMNGSAAIHDFEIAIAGQTSEDVESVLPDGRFGTAEETGREMNQAIECGDRDGIGIGEALGRILAEGVSITRTRVCWRRLTVLPFRSRCMLPSEPIRRIRILRLMPAAIGRGTHHDFRLFCTLVSGLHDGGVYLNVGSAVVMPEVFLKAVSAVRNLGNPLANFTTVNFDFLQHYRPRVNVVERPHAKSGGRGYAITGHHELMLPLLAAALIEDDADVRC